MDSPGSMKAVSWRMISGMARKKAMAMAAQPMTWVRPRMTPRSPSDGRTVRIARTARSRASTITQVMRVGMVTALREEMTARVRRVAKTTAPTAPVRAEARRQRLARGQPSTRAGVRMTARAAYRRKGRVAPPTTET